MDKCFVVGNGLMVYGIRGNECYKDIVYIGKCNGFNVFGGEYINWYRRVGYWMWCIVGINNGNVF